MLKTCIQNFESLHLKPNSAACLLCEPGLPTLGPILLVIIRVAILPQRTGCKALWVLCSADEVRKQAPKWKLVSMTPCSIYPLDHQLQSVNEDSLQHNLFHKLLQFHENKLSFCLLSSRSLFQIFTSFTIHENPRFLLIHI